MMQPAGVQELNAYLKALKPYYYFVEPRGKELFCSCFTNFTPFVAHPKL